MPTVAMTAVLFCGCTPTRETPSGHLTLQAVSREPGESEGIPLPQLQGPHCFGPPMALRAKLALPSAHGRLGGAEEEVPPGESGEKGAELNLECALQTCYSRSRSGCRLKRAF